ASAPIPRFTSTPAGSKPAGVVPILGGSRTPVTAQWPRAPASCQSPRARTSPPPPLPTLGEGVAYRSRRHAGAPVPPGSGSAMGARVLARGVNTAIVCRGVNGERGVPHEPTGLRGDVRAVPPDRPPALVSAR